MAEPDYTNLSEAEMDALLEQEHSQVVSPEPSPAEATPEEPPVEEAEDEPVAAPEEEEVPVEASSDEPTEEEIEATIIDIEGERIEREKMAAKLAFQEAHSSRLAGEIGFLKEQLKSRSFTGEPYEPQSQEEMDRLTTLEQRFRDSETRTKQFEVAQAVESTLGAMDAAEIQPLAEELRAVAPRYIEAFNATRSLTDVALARQTADAIGRSMIADAKELAWSNRRKSLEEKRAVQASGLKARKKAATVSGTGASSNSNPARTKSYDEMTSEELDAAMDAEFGRRHG